MIKTFPTSGPIEKYIVGKQDQTDVASDDAPAHRLDAQKR